MKISIRWRNASHQRKQCHIIPTSFDKMLILWRYDNFSLNFQQSNKNRIKEKQGKIFFTDVKPNQTLTNKRRNVAAASWKCTTKDPHFFLVDAHARPACCGCYLWPSGLLKVRTRLLPWKRFVGACANGRTSVCKACVIALWEPRFLVFEIRYNGIWPLSTTNL